MNDIEERIRAAFEPYQVQTDRGRFVPYPSPPAKRGHGRGSQRALYAAAVVFALVLIVALPTLLPGGRVGGADPAAAATLHRAAEAVRAEPWFGSLKEGQYLHFKMVEASSCGTKGGLTGEWWLGRDGSGTGLNTPPGRRYVLSPTTSLFNYWAYANYPTDPQALSARFASDPNFGGGVPDFMGSGDAATFSKIHGLLGEFTAPPDLRAALFEAAASLPGVELIGTVQDSLGRSGTALGYTYEGIRDELVFDPATAQLLATEWVLVDPQAAAAAGRTSGCSGGAWPTGPAGSVLDSVSFDPPVVVDSVP